MARILLPPIFATQLILIISLSLSSFALILVHAHEDDHDFVTAMDPDVLGLKKQKLTHFRLYWHDILSGKNPTSVSVVNPPPSTNSPTLFGLVRMIDNPLTEKLEMSSRELGRAQGFYASAAQQELGFLMSMNFHFTQGKFNGSTITVMGRNPALENVREMPVIGGSGLFRFARGYVQARTHTLNMSTGDATVEYNCYVLHY